MRLNLLALDRFEPQKEVSADTFSEDDLVAALDAARNTTTDTDRLVPRIADILRDAASERLRNAAALTLADLGDRRGAEALIDVLRRPDMAGTSGTLIYALAELGAALPLDVLASIILNGSFEARAMALDLLDDGLVSGLDREAEAAARRSLADLAASDDAEGSHAAREALQGLDDLDRATT